MIHNRATLKVSISCVLGLGLLLGLLILMRTPPTAVRAAPALTAAEGAAPAMSSDAPAAPRLTTGTVITVCPGGGCDFETVQAAVDAAAEGDEIRVAAGTYTDVSARGGITQVLYIDKSVTVRGGYTTTDWTAFDPGANATTLDAQGRGRVLYVTDGISLTVEGFRLTGGTAAGLGGAPDGRDAGGGVYIAAASATISGCQVVSNTAVWGGGIYVGGGTYAILNNRIEANEGLRVDAIPTRGGGVYLRGGGGLVAGNTIAANRIGWEWGGGIYLYQSDASLEDNLVTNNAAVQGGGGVHAWNGAPRLANNLITNNAGEWGGGVNLDRSSGDITGNQVLSNTATYGGGGLCFLESSASLAGNTVRSNSARYGGGVYLNGKVFTLDGNIVQDNSASESGGGLFVYAATAALVNSVVVDNRAMVWGAGVQTWAASLRLTHCTIARNTNYDVVDAGSTGHVQSTDGDGSGIYLLGGGRAVLTNTILVGHAVGVFANGDTAVNLRQTLWDNDVDWSGPGTITRSGDYWGDPAFVDPDGGNYRITAASDAVNRGVDAGVYHDIEGDPRPLGGGFDLGADEFATIDLSASRKTVQPDRAGADDVLTYTIVLLNRGNMWSPDTLLVDSLPTQTTYISGSAATSAGTVTGSDTIRWSGPLTPHQPVTITFSVTLEEAALVHNTAVVTDARGGVTALRALVNGQRLYLPLVLAGWPAHP